MLFPIIQLSMNKTKNLSQTVVKHQTQSKRLKCGKVLEIFASKIQSRKDTPTCETTFPEFVCAFSFPECSETLLLLRPGLIADAFCCLAGPWSSRDDDVDADGKPLRDESAAAW